MKLKTTLYLLLLLFNFACTQTTGQYPIHAQYKASDKPILVFLTGDGGWNNFSIQLANELNKNGYSVLSLDTRKYFWEQKNPNLFASDINLIINQYLKLWNKASFYIVGYSFGAEVATFLPTHLPVATSKKIKALVLLSPGYSNSFEVRFLNIFFGKNTNKDRYKILPELLKTKVPIKCIFGEEEETDISQDLKDTNTIKKVTIPGSHHYKNDIQTITTSIIKAL